MTKYASCRNRNIRILVLVVSKCFVIVCYSNIKNNIMGIKACSTYLFWISNGTHDKNEEL